MYTGKKKLGQKIGFSQPLVDSIKCDSGFASTTAFSSADFFLPYLTAVPDDRIVLSQKINLYFFPVLLRRRAFTPHKGKNICKWSKTIPLIVFNPYIFVHIGQQCANGYHKLRKLAVSVRATYATLHWHLS